MDSGNSGSISSSGDEEYDSRADTVSPLSLPPFLNAPTQFGSISHPHPHYFSLLSHPQTPNPSIFNPSPNNYLQSQPSSIPNPSASQTPGCEPTSILLPQGVLSSSLGQYSIEPSLQLRSVQNHNDHRDVSAPTTTTNAVRNPKKRSRASRRAPTTVLTTDTSNFRSMVQEFTGIPAPPFSSSSYSRRLNLLSSPSNLFRPSFHKLRSPNPSSLLSSSHNTMVDANAIASTTDNYHQLLPDLGLPNMLCMQHDHPTFPLTVPLPGFTSKYQSPLLQQGQGMNHTQLNPQFTSGQSMPTGNGHAVSEVVPDGIAVGGVASGGRRDQLRSFEVSYAKVGAATGKLNFAGSSSCSFDHDKTLENNTSNRGEATLDSWICSSD